MSRSRRSSPSAIARPGCCSVMVVRRAIAESESMAKIVGSIQWQIDHSPRSRCWWWRACGLGAGRPAAVVRIRCAAESACSRSPSVQNMLLGRAGGDWGIADHPAAGQASGGHPGPRRRSLRSASFRMGWPRGWYGPATHPGPADGWHAPAMCSATEVAGQLRTADSGIRNPCPTTRFVAACDR